MATHIQLSYCVRMAPLLRSVTLDLVGIFRLSHLIFKVV